jgi:hypothetical protein
MEQKAHAQLPKEFHLDSWPADDGHLNFRSKDPSADHITPDEYCGAAIWIDHIKTVALHGSLIYTQAKCHQDAVEFHAYGQIERGTSEGARDWQRDARTCDDAIACCKRLDPPRNGWRICIRRSSRGARAKTAEHCHEGRMHASKHESALRQ